MTCLDREHEPWRIRTGACFFSFFVKDPHGITASTLEVRGGLVYLAVQIGLYKSARMCLTAQEQTCTADREIIHLQWCWSEAVSIAHSWCCGKSGVLFVWLCYRFISRELYLVTPIVQSLMIIKSFANCINNSFIMFVTITILHQPSHLGLPLIS